MLYTYIEIINTNINLFYVNSAEIMHKAVFAFCLLAWGFTMLTANLMCSLTSNMPRMNSSQANTLVNDISSTFCLFIAVKSVTVAVLRGVCV